jgi:urocanate hydratase
MRKQIELRQQDPAEYIERSYESMYIHVQLMLQLMDRGAITFDYGNNIRARAKEIPEDKTKNQSNQLQLQGYNEGFKGIAFMTGRCFNFPGFVPASYPTFILRGKRSFPMGCTQW